MIRIYHNARCAKSRAGLQALQATGKDFQIVEYLKQQIEFDGFKKLLMKLNLPAAHLVRKQEDVFKSRFKGKNFTDDEWIKLIMEFPNLLRRPIIELPYKAAVCDDAETLADFINELK
jgi:arsenate reductase